MTENTKIVTYNLRNTWSRDGINSFIHRVGLLYDTLGKELPDIIAFQEVMPEQLTLLQRILPDYTFYGQGRNADDAGEGLYTAVRTSLWRVILYETVWISPTPYVPASRFAIQSDCPRICVVTDLRRRDTGAVLRVMNIHLDHISDEARREGVRFLAEEIRRRAVLHDLPVVLLGDFNATPESETIRACRAETGLSDLTQELAYTYHGYGTDRQKIDYIFVSEAIRDAALRTSCFDTCHDGIYLSDHYPVCATLDTEKLPHEGAHT